MNLAETSRRIRVAVVEDNAAFRRGLLAIFGFMPDLECVGMCPSGEEALRELPRWEMDVVLMDINLPGISGVETARELKRMRPATQILMLTIEDDSERVFAALRAGAAGYLLKAATPTEIIEGIQLVARGGSPMSAVIARRVVESFHGQTTPGDEKSNLTPREREVLQSIASGRRVKEVAADLGVSPTTVQTYLRRVYEKLQVHSQAEAVAKFLR